MIARIKVLHDKATDFCSFPIAEKVRGGWQSGAQFYPDAKVVAVIGEYRPTIRTRLGLFRPGGGA